MAGARSWHGLCRGIREQQPGASGIAARQGQAGEGTGREGGEWGQERGWGRG